MKKGIEVSRDEVRARGISMFIAFVFLSATVFATVFDSFGISSAMNNLAERAGTFVLAPLYTKLHGSSRQRISVILITDQSLDQSGEMGRASYEMQADLIALAAAYGARAVFMDFTYDHLRENRDEASFLAQTAVRANSDGMPVFFGPVDLTDELASLRQVSTAGVNWSHSLDNAYPFFDDVGRPMAATALYRVLCADAGDCSTSFLKNLENPIPQKRFMAVQWGEGSPEAMSLYWSRSSVRECVQRTKQDAIARSVRNLFRNLFNALNLDMTKSANGVCVYHLSAPASVVLNPAADEASMRAFFEGRAVFVGSAVKSVGDYASAPGFGMVPGVFYHAMALDNLLSFGPRYIRPSPTFYLAMSISDLLYLLVLILMIWGTALASERIWDKLQAYEAADVAEKECQRKRHLRHAGFSILGWVGLSFALVIGLSFAIFVIFRWSLNDVLGVLLLLLAVRLVPDWKVIACFFRQCRRPSQKNPAASENKSDQNLDSVPKTRPDRPQAEEKEGVSLP